MTRTFISHHVTRRYPCPGLKRRRAPGSERGFSSRSNALAGGRFVAIGFVTALLLMLLQPARRTAATPRPLRGHAFEGGNGFVNPASLVAQFPKDFFEIHTFSQKTTGRIYPTRRAFAQPSSTKQSSGQFIALSRGKGRVRELGAAVTPAACRMME